MATASMFITILAKLGQERHNAFRYFSWYCDNQESLVCSFEINDVELSGIHKLVMLEPISCNS